MESLLYLKHQGDEILTPGDKNDLKKGDLLLCPPDIAYPILSNNLSVLRTLIEVHQKVKYFSCSIANERRDKWKDR